MTKDSKKPKHTSRHKPAKKVFDVMRPGKTPALATSRPVIPAQKPPVADDQFVPGAPSLRAGDPAAKHDLLNPKNKKELQPLSSEGDSNVPAGSPDDRAQIKSGAEPTSTGEVPAASAAPVIAGAPALPGAEKHAPAAEIPLTAATPAERAAPDSAPSESVSAAASIKTDVGVSGSPAADMGPSIAAAEASSKGPASTSTASADSAVEPAASRTGAEEDTPAHLAMEQTVQTDPGVPIWEQPENSVQVETAPRPDSDRPASSKSIEDLLAETGAPTLEPEKTPSLIISHHKPHASGGKILLVIFLVLFLAVVALDLLLDAEIIKTGLDIPRTDFL